MSNWIRLGLGVSVAFLIYKTTPLLDLLTLLLYLLIPVAFVLSVLSALGGAVGIVGDNTNIGTKLEQWTHGTQQWLADKRAEAVARFEQADVPNADETPTVA